MQPGNMFSGGPKSIKKIDLEGQDPEKDKGFIKEDKIVTEVKQLEKRINFLDRDIESKINDVLKKINPNLRLGNDTYFPERYLEIMEIKDGKEEDRTDLTYSAPLILGSVFGYKNVVDFFNMVNQGLQADYFDYLDSLDPAYETKIKESAQEKENQMYPNIDLENNLGFLKKVVKNKEDFLLVMEDKIKSPNFEDLLKEKTRDTENLRNLKIGLENKILEIGGKREDSEYHPEMTRLYDWYGEEIYHTGGSDVNYRRGMEYLRLRYPDFFLRDGIAGEEGLESLLRHVRRQQELLSKIDKKDVEDTLKSFDHTLLDKRSKDLIRKDGYLKTKLEDHNVSNQRQSKDAPWFYHDFYTTLNKRDYPCKILDEKFRKMIKKDDKIEIISVKVKGMYLGSVREISYIKILNRLDSQNSLIEISGMEYESRGSEISYWINKGSFSDQYRSDRYQQRDMVNKDRYDYVMNYAKNKVSNFNAEQEALKDLSYENGGDYKK